MLIPPGKGGGGGLGGGGGQGPKPPQGSLSHPLCIIGALPGLCPLILTLLAFLEGPAFPKQILLQAGC